MTIARHYLMIAKDDQTDALREALIELAAKVRPIEGCEGVALFQDTRTATRFTFIEYWATIEAHKLGGKQLGPEALAPILAVIASPPEGAYLEQIAL